MLINCNYEQHVNKENKPLSKPEAINMFQDRGFCLDVSNTTYSRDFKHKFYWMNIYKKIFDGKRNIILNDSVKQKLFLYIIPDINSLGFKHKPGLTNVYDVLIGYRDKNMVDQRSGVSLKKYYVDSIDYKY